jgi:hypothetical protein
MVPIIDGKLYHFGPRGLYNGLILLGDDETRSYWDHITGECVHGPMKGKKMEMFSIEHTTVTRALKTWPDLKVALSRPPFLMRLIAPIMKKSQKKGFLPPFFRKTMSSVDTRLPEMTSGLGVITDHVQRFYPVQAIKEAGGKLQDQLDGQLITVYIDPDDQVPHAIYDSRKDEERPMQLFSRWYGFYLTYPDCEIYSLKENS